MRVRDFSVLSCPEGQNPVNRTLSGWVGRIFSLWTGSRQQDCHSHLWRMVGDGGQKIRISQCLCIDETTKRLQRAVSALPAFFYAAAGINLAVIFFRQARKTSMPWVLDYGLAEFRD